MICDYLLLINLGKHLLCTMLIQNILGNLLENLLLLRFD